MDQNGKDQKKMDPMMAGIAGAVVGAGVAAVATKVLSDKKTRDKIKETVTNARDRVVSYAHRISREAKDKGEMAKDKLKEGREAIKEASSNRSR